MDYLGLNGKRVLVFGVSNRKSVAFHIGKLLTEQGAEPIFSVQRADQREVVERYFPGAGCYECDVCDDAGLERLALELKSRYGELHGLVHSVAHANYSEGIKAFDETVRKDFLDAMDVSCFSLIRMAGVFKGMMSNGGAVVTISISSTRLAAESYGYMAPVKAALDASVCFLAKSLSGAGIRVNAVGASPLKTSASAGIPGYIDAYLYAERATLRKRAVETGEVADVALFLLSPRSSGINAQTVVVDAGMGVNFFDRELVGKALS